MNDFEVRLIELGTAEAAGQLEQIHARSKMENASVNETVVEILQAVKTEGDAALQTYSKKFDGVSPEAFEVSQKEMDEAVQAIDSQLFIDLEQAATSVRAFHEAQLVNTQTVELTDSDGSKVSLIERPLQRVGIYVPGGTAPLPSSVLMNALPAAVAGVPEIYMCTPPDKEGKIAPVILAAAAMSGVKKVFKVGGAQAIAALAYGTESIPAVDKITGPGNIYVNVAKRLVYGTVDIDMFAGPSEILIIADETAEPAFVACDMLSQAEHDRLASAVLVTDSEALAKAVGTEISKRAAMAPRSDILRSSIRDYAAILLCRDLTEAVALSNEIAPEHLEIMVAEEKETQIIAGIQNAGAIFIGKWSPEPLGDYYAGPNHTLPTSGTARFFSPLNVSQFRKKISLIHYTEASLTKVGPTVERLAMAESLDCHAEAIRIRRKGR